jgi:N-acetylmuramoyl-L-alanine amidase.
VRRWHVEGRGWRGIGYNWIVGIDGQEVKGRDLDNDGDPWEEIAAHTQGKNSTTIGIAMEPIWTDDHEADGNPWDFFTGATLRAVEKRIQWLFDEYPTLRWVEGHNAFAAKACPQFRAERWFDMNTLAFRRARGPARPAAPVRDWVQIQRKLDTLGYGPGAVDGIRGPNTNAALAAYGLDRLLEELG